MGVKSCFIFPVDLAFVAPLKNRTSYRRCMIKNTIPNSTSRRLESMFTTPSGFIAPILAQERLAFMDPKASPLAEAFES